jgi:predicted transglutaminase-like cysteine proteinase
LPSLQTDLANLAAIQRLCGKCGSNNRVGAKHNASEFPARLWRCRGSRGNFRAAGRAGRESRHPAECESKALEARDVVLTQKAWKDLVRINAWVNTTIKPKTDLEHWGVVEKWSYPDDGYGDCEDYVLLKRKLLIQAGWPRQALLITVVREQNGDGHAVLTVKTDKGEFILDNQNTEILLWSETTYRFVKRQAQSDPNTWVALGDSRPTLATATSR